MSDIINALTSAPHGATHIGFYGDDIIFIKEHEEARSDAWGIESTQWQEIEDFDVSLIYGVRAIKDVKIEAELLKQIELIKAERDALAREVDAANDRNAELIEERDALVAQLAKIDRAWADAGGWPDTAEEIEEICGAITSSPQQCLAKLKAQVANDVAVYICDRAIKSAVLTSNVIQFASEYATTVRQGGAE